MVAGAQLRRLYDTLPAGGSATAEKLAAATGLPRKEIAAAVAALRAAGALVAGDGFPGYGRRVPPPLDEEAVAAAVTGEMGHDVRVFGAVATTMATARALLNAGAGHGVAVLAEAQAAGRGRRGRRWASPPGLGIYLSVILETARLPDNFSVLPLLAGVAAADAIAAEAAVAVGLKWPNDLMWDDEKLGGIIVESSGEAGAVVVGVGVNVFHCPFDFPAGLRYPATSLAMAGARSLERNALAAAILNQLGGWLSRWLSAGTGAVIRAWRDRTITLGRRVHIAGTEISGVALDVTDDGALVIEDGAGQRHNITAADVIANS